MNKIAKPFLKQNHPSKVKEIYSALKRDHPEYSAGKKARIANSKGASWSPDAIQGFLDKAAHYGLTRNQALMLMKRAIDMPTLGQGAQAVGQGLQNVGQAVGQGVKALAPVAKAVAPMAVPAMGAAKYAPQAISAVGKGMQTVGQGVQNAGNWLGNKFGSVDRIKAQGFLDKAAERGISEAAAVAMLKASLDVSPDAQPALGFEQGMSLGTAAGYPIGHRLALPIADVIKAVRGAKTSEERQAALMPLLKTLAGVGVGGLSGGALAVGTRLADDMAMRQSQAV